MILESRPLHKKKKRLAKSRSRDSSRDSAQSVSAGRGALCTSASCRAPRTRAPGEPCTRPSRSLGAFPPPALAQPRLQLSSPTSSSEALTSSSDPLTSCLSPSPPLSGKK